MKDRLLRSLAALALGTLVNGCAATIAPVRELPSSALGTLQKVPTRYESPAEGASSSGDDLAKRFEGATTQAVRDGGLRHDPALDIVATVFAIIYSHDQQMPADSLTRWLFWKAGVVGTYHNAQIGYASGSTARSYLDEQVAKVANQLKPAPYPLSFGIARIGGAGFSQAIVLATRPIELAALEKRFTAGASVEISGKFRGPYDRPKVYFDLGNAKVESSELKVEQDGSFKVSHALPRAPGRYFIELTTLDPNTKGTSEATRWQRGLLLLPLYVDQDEPSQPEEWMRHPPANPQSRAAWAARLLEIYNESRRELGAPPLTLHIGVSEAAMERAQEFSANENLPPDAALDKKLSRRGATPINFYQSQSHVEYIEELAHLNLLSPAHRAAVLDAASTVAGLGFAPSGNQYAYVEYLVTPVPKYEREAENARLFSTVNGIRRAKGLREYKPFSRIDTMVNNFAASVCKGATKGSNMEALFKQLAQVHYRKLETLYVSAVSLTDHDLDRGYEAMLEGNHTHLSIGTCRGSFADYLDGEYVLFVAIDP